MEKEKIIKLAEELVKITIEKHNQNLLGQEKMFIFLRKHIKEEITTSDFDSILHHYSKILSKSGYEIIKDINHFDIIDYNSNEYRFYRDTISECLKIDIDSINKMPTFI